MFFPRMRKAIDNPRGLTLIELLIVLALISFVIAGFFYLFSFVFQSWSLVEEESQRLQEARIALDILGKDIQNAKPLEDNYIGVVVLDNSREKSAGNELRLGPESKGQIRYWLNDGKLYRQERDETGRFVDTPGVIVELANGDAEKPFKLQNRSVEVFWQVDNSDGKGKLQPREIKELFSARNGQVEEEN